MARGWVMAVVKIDLGLSWCWVKRKNCALTEEETLKHAYSWETPAFPSRLER